MINLLPPEDKKKLLLEKKIRMILILCVLVGFFLISLTLILLTTKIYLKNQILSQKTVLEEVERETGQSETQNLREKINSVNQTLTKLKTFYEQKIYFSEIFERISRTLPSGLYLTDLSAAIPTTEKEPGIKISLGGFAKTRESLLDFNKNLEKEKSFKDPYFPPSNWAKSTNIDFSVTFTIGD